MFQLRFRASELLYVREGRQALVDRKPFSQSDLEKTKHFLFRKAMRTVPGVKETFSLLLSGLRLSFKGSSFFGSFGQGSTGTQSILL